MQQERFNYDRGVINANKFRQGKHKKSISYYRTSLSNQQSRLVEKLAELVNTGKINGISDIRDESDRDGMKL